jgi:hypothetical protein
MDRGLEAWPKCTQCDGRRFERRPFASEDIICLNCGYVSKAADRERESAQQPIDDEPEKGHPIEYRHG